MIIASDILTSGVSSATYWPQGEVAGSEESRYARASEGTTTRDRAELQDPNGSQKPETTAYSEGLRLAREMATGFNRELRFYKDEQTGRMAAKIVDRTSGKVTRYIPPEEVLRLAARMAEVAALLRGDDAHPDPTYTREIFEGS